MAVRVQWATFQWWVFEEFYKSMPTHSKDWWGCFKFPKISLFSNLVTNLNCLYLFIFTIFSLVFTHTWGNAFCKKKKKQTVKCRQIDAANWSLNCFISTTLPCYIVCCRCQVYCGLDRNVYFLRDLFCWLRPLIHLLVLF